MVCNLLKECVIYVIICTSDKFFECYMYFTVLLRNLSVSLRDTLKSQKKLMLQIIKV